MERIHAEKIAFLFEAVKVKAKSISGRFVEMDDLVQTTMEKILRADLLPEEPGNKWIFACTVNARNDILRKIHKESKVRDFSAPVDSIRISYEPACRIFVPSVVY